MMPFKYMAGWIYMQGFGISPTEIDEMFATVRLCIHDTINATGLSNASQ
jgi:hypothetical protein